MLIFQLNAYTYVEYSDIKMISKFTFRSSKCARYKLKVPCGVYNF
jgi:hypothetical protein